MYFIRIANSSPDYGFPINKSIPMYIPKTNLLLQSVKLSYQRYHDDVEMKRNKREKEKEKLMKETKDRIEAE